MARPPANQPPHRPLSRRGRTGEPAQVLPTIRRWCRHGAGEARAAGSRLRTAGAPRPGGCAAGGGHPHRAPGPGRADLHRPRHHRVHAPGRAPARRRRPHHPVHPEPARRRRPDHEAVPEQPGRAGRRSGAGHDDSPTRHPDHQLAVPARPALVQRRLRRQHRRPRAGRVRHPGRQHRSLRVRPAGPAVLRRRRRRRDGGVVGRDRRRAPRALGRRRAVRPDDPARRAPGRLPGVRQRLRRRVHGDHQRDGGQGLQPRRAAST